MHNRSLTYLGLGSNIGDSLGWLKFAIERLPNVRAVSPVYSTEPVGGPDQDDFLNLVAELAWDGDPHELLDICLAIEQEAGRERLVLNGPRTLDIDVLLCKGLTINTPDLKVPHPRMNQRNFVIEPLLDLFPGFDESLSAGTDGDRIGEVTRLGPLNLLAS